MTNFQLWKKLCDDSLPVRVNGGNAKGLGTADIRYREYYQTGEITLIRSDRHVSKWLRDMYWCHIKGEDWLISFRLSREALHIRGNVEAGEEALTLWYLKY